MTRRPRSRRPPRLPDPPVATVPRAVKARTQRDRLKEAQVAGRSNRFGREEVRGLMRRVVEGNPRALLGLPPFEMLSTEQVEAAVQHVYGWSGDGTRARIDPDRTVEGFTFACERVLEVARAGGRIAFATGRPAALFEVYRALAAAASDAGGKVLERVESGVFGGGRRLWWADGVAVVSDQGSLLADEGVRAGEELLFVGEPLELVVADRGFAGVALTAGLEVVTLADLDALALAVASWQGMAVRVAPLDDHRPPACYEPLLDLVDEVTARMDEHQREPRPES